MLLAKSLLYSEFSVVYDPKRLAIFLRSLLMGLRSKKGPTRYLPGFNEFRTFIIRFSGPCYCLVGNLLDAIRWSFTLFRVSDDI